MDLINHQDPPVHRPTGTLAQPGACFDVTLQEFRKLPSALKVSKSSVLALDLSKETAESLREFKLEHLRILAQVVGCRKSGTMDELIPRMMATCALRGFIAGHTQESLSALKGKELKELSRRAGTYIASNKLGMATALLNWRLGLIATGRRLITEANWKLRIERHLLDGGTLSERVQQDVKAHAPYLLVEGERRAIQMRLI